MIMFVTVRIALTRSCSHVTLVHLDAPAPAGNLVTATLTGASVVTLGIILFLHVMMVAKFLGYGRMIGFATAPIAKTKTLLPVRRAQGMQALGVRVLVVTSFVAKLSSHALMILMDAFYHWRTRMMVFAIVLALAQTSQPISLAPLAFAPRNVVNPIQVSSKKMSLLYNYIYIYTYIHFIVEGYFQVKLNFQLSKTFRVLNAKSQRRE